MRLFIAFCLMLTLAGCPGIKVVKNPGDRDKGVRYYRPKPYLLVVPAGTTTITKSTPAVEVKEPSDETVSISLEYLPDFSEEYAIHVRTGVGLATVNMTLEDGWNLTKIDQVLDSNVDDNIKAIAELTRAVGEVAPVKAGGEAQPGAEQTKRFVVKATNVPLGYYESAIGHSPDGTKRLCGWRYVGFAPFNSCSFANCENPNPAVFGLVFEKGVMVFRELGAVQFADTTRVAVDTGDFKPSARVYSLDDVKTELKEIAIRNGMLDAEIVLSSTTDTNPKYKITVRTNTNSDHRRTNAISEFREFSKKVNSQHEIETDVITFEKIPLQMDQEQTSLQFPPIPGQAEFR